LSRRPFETIRSIPDRAGSIRSIALVRAIAVLLVVWDHGAGRWTERHGRSWIPLDTVQDWVTDPLEIIQDTGWLGVVLFFLVSGYIISEVGTKETRRSFAIRRFLRIYPPLWASFVLIIGVEMARGALDRPHVDYSADQVMWAASLVNYANGVKGVNGVAWTLIIEVLFYALVLTLLPLLARRPLIAIGVELVVVMGVIASARSFPIDRFDSDWHLLAVSISYLPLLVIGQCIWMWNARNVSAARAATLGALAWLVFVFGMRRLNPKFLIDGNLYGPSVAIAIAIVLIALLTEGRWRLPRWLAAVSVISYSVYLVHGTVLNVVLDALDGRVPFTLALAAAVVAIAVVSVAMWRFVEMPSQQLARRLSPRREPQRTSPG
jgi:peptidoglycan/LPS O-acetylase OafA/YrhL